MSLKKNIAAYDSTIEQLGEVFSDAVIPAGELDNPDKFDVEDQAKRKEQLENDDLAARIKGRTELGKKIFNLIEKWLFFIGILLLSNSFIFKLSDSVLITLLSTTTINVIALAVIVTKGYFSKN